MRRQSSIDHHWVEPYLFLLPALALYALFVLLPVAESFRLSLFEWRHLAAQPEFVMFDNFRALLHDEVFWTALWHNALLLMLSLVTQLPLALFLAVLLSYPTGARTLFRTVLFAPMVMPTVAIAVLWGFVYLPEQGLLDQLISMLGGSGANAWLANPETALLCVFATICWRYTGFYLVLFMAALTAIPDELYEAARLDGAGEWQLCRHVTLPLIRPMLGVAATLSVIGSLKYFDLVYMMAGGAPEKHRELMATYIYRLAFSSGQGRYGYGSAAAVYLFIIALATVLVVLRIQKKRADTIS